MLRNQSFSSTKPKKDLKNMKNNLSNRKITKNEEIEIIILLEKCIRKNKDLCN